MTHNLHVLQEWIRVVVIISATCTTSVPILYSFFPWRKRKLGRILMAKAISFAVAMDLSAFFTIWTPSDILVLFWIDAIVLTGIAISTFAMAWYMVRILIIEKRGNKLDEDQQQGLRRS